MTSVRLLTVTEAWATVTATDSASPITGEQRVTIYEDADLLPCYSYSRCGRNNCLKAFKSAFPGEEYKVTIIS